MAKSYAKPIGTDFMDVFEAVTVEPLLVCGDSLLLDIFQVGEYRCQEHLTTLPLVFLVEQWLSRFKSVTVKLFFLGSNRALWSHLPQGALVREILISHLSRTLEVFCFANSAVPEFFQLLLSSGAVITANEHLVRRFGESTGVEVDLWASLLRPQLRFFLSSRISVFYVCDTIEKHDRVFGHYVNVEWLEEEDAATVTEPLIAKPLVQPRVDSVKEIFASTELPAGATFAQKVLFAALKGMDCSKDELSVTMSRLVLLHTSAINTLPLSLRSLRPDAFATKLSADALTWLSALALEMSMVLRALTLTYGRQKLSEEGLADLLDGTLVASLVGLMGENVWPCEPPFGLPDSEMAVLAAFGKMLGVNDGDFEPLPALDEVIQPIAPAVPSDSHPMPEPHVCPIKWNMTAQWTGKTTVKEEMDPGYDEWKEKADAIAAKEDWAQLNAFINIKFTKEVLSETAQLAEWNMTKKQQDRSEQRHVAWIQKYAQSLLNSQMIRSTVFPNPEHRDKAAVKAKATAEKAKKAKVVKEKQKMKGGGKGKPGAKKGQASVKEQIKKSIEERDAKRLNTKETSKKNIFGSARMLTKEKRFREALVLLEELLESNIVPVIRRDILIEMLKVGMVAWSNQRELVDDRPRGAKMITFGGYHDAGDLNFAVDVVISLQRLLEMTVDPKKAAEANLKGEARKQVMSNCLSVFKTLGFDEVVAKLETALRVSASDASVGDASAHLPVGMNFIQFQMLAMGPHMERLEGKKDELERVPFIPDDWQKNLLDIVDARESALVVAPTSSGKTFVSYYAMESVLRADDSAKIIYVAPTKALVNQVVADVYARFGNKTYLTAAAVWGIFTQEIRTNVENSQVLVTVPECLEALLLSPQGYSHLHQLQYVIFDEVHNLNVSTSGEFWEHSLSMIPCPFLALSATVGNPGDFEDWLVRLQNMRQFMEAKAGTRVMAPTVAPMRRKVHLVPHSDRFSDLQAYIWSPPVRPVEAVDEDGVPEMIKDFTIRPTADPLPAATIPVHPIATLFQLPVPDCVRLSPKECLDLQKVMAQILGVRLRLAEEAMAEESSSGEEDSEEEEEEEEEEGEEEESATAEAGVKEDRKETSQTRVAELPAKELVALLKTELNLIQKDLHPILHLTEAAEAAAKKMAVETDHRQLTLLRTCFLKRWSVRSYETKLKECLNRWGEHPQLKPLAEAICKYIRQGCDVCVSGSEKGWQRENIPLGSDEFGERNIVEIIQSLHAQEKLPALFFVMKPRQIERLGMKLLTVLETQEMLWKRSVGQSDRKDAKAAKREERLKEKSTIKGKFSKDQKADLMEQKEDHTTKSEKVDVRFALTVKEQAIWDVISEVVAGRKKMAKGWTVEHPYVRLLLKGVGMHHGALPNRYRQSVERLFRMKLLQVVIATDTLSQGIHMPCKAVVFYGDDVLLNTVNFRQMSGRAGRRGYDLVGHNIFCGVPLPKVKRLLSSGLPSLRGYCSQTSSLVLRGTRQYWRTPLDRTAVQIKLDTRLRLVQHATVCLFREPFLIASTRDNPALRSQASLLTRFAMDHLVRNHFITAEGKPAGGADVVVQLTNMVPDGDPGNIVFMNLLRSGALHELCDSNLSSTAKKQCMLQILANLFDRCFMANQAPVMEAGSLYSVELPELPSAQLDVIDKFNREVLTLLTEYVAAAAETTISGSSTALSLPLTKQSFEKEEVASPLAASLQKKAQTVKVRSPFVAIAGKGDQDFTCVSELLQSMRHDIYLDRSAVPALELRSWEQKLPLNAYVSDFFMGGLLSTMEEVHGFRDSVAWYHLSNFSQRLVMLAHCLSTLTSYPGTDSKGGDSVVATIVTLANEFETKFAKASEKESSKRV